MGLLLKIVLYFIGLFIGGYLINISTFPDKGMLAFLGALIWMFLTVGVTRAHYEEQLKEKNKTISDLLIERHK